MWYNYKTKCLNWAGIISGVTSQSEKLAAQETKKDLKVFVNFPAPCALNGKQSQKLIVTMRSKPVISKPSPKNKIEINFKFRLSLIA